LSKPPLRVLYIETCVGMAGGQVSLIELLKHLDATRFAALVACPAESPLRRRCDELGVAWLPLPFRSVHLSGRTGRGAGAALHGAIEALEGIGFLASAIRRNRIDIVHANTFKAALVGGIACLLAGRPMVFHDRIQITHGILGRLVAIMAARIIVVSESVGSKHRGAAARKVRMIHDGIDVEHFAFVAAPASGPVVGFIGRLSEEKGLASLVEAAAAVLGRIPAARFVVVGEPFTPGDARHLAEVKTRIRDLGLVAAFGFRGYIEDVRDFLGTIRVLALPSRRESLGLVVLEAMAVGRPVVAFDVGGLREIITNNEDGILVDPGDVPAFARALMSLLGDADLARRMGEKGRAVVVSRFSSDLSVRRTMDVYGEIRPERRDARA
jgi:glycosyltransferase involved in cell wall biosynthesis